MLRETEILARIIRHIGKRWLLYAGLVAAVVVGVIYGPEFMRLFGSEEAIEQTIQSWGALGPVAFLVMNIAQVIVAPIPGTAIGVVGGYLFGVWLGFALNLLGILIGSLVVFTLARRLGKPFVDRFVGPRTAQFLQRVAEKNGIRGLTLVFLLPFLPDDALCFMAGLTPIRTRTFILIVLIGRTPGSFVASLTGAGLVDLPLWAWAVVGLVGISLFVLWWRKGDQIEAWFRGLFGSEKAENPSEK